MTLASPPLTRLMKVRADLAECRRQQDEARLLEDKPRQVVLDARLDTLIELHRTLLTSCREAGVDV